MFTVDGQQQTHINVRTIDCLAFPLNPTYTQEWWKWREFAAGQGELSPFPSTIAVSELDSLLRFVDDPEDAFLLLHWFPIRRSPESLAPARHREAIVSPVAALESSEEALGARNPSNVVGGKHSEGSLVASLGDAIKSGDLSKGGDGVSTQADANEGGDALKTEAQESAGMLGIQISRTASMAMFKTRPSSMVSLPRTSSQEEDQDIEQWIVLSDDEASAAVAQTNNKSQRLSATGHWGASSRRRLGTTVAPHRRSFFVQLDVSCVLLSVLACALDAVVLCYVQGQMSNAPPLFLSHSGKVYVQQSLKIYTGQNFPRLIQTIPTLL